MSRPNDLRHTMPRLQRVIRYFGRDLLRERRLLVLGLVALFAQVGFRLLEPWPLKYLVDSVLGSTPWPKGLRAVGDLEPTALLLLLASVLFAIVLCRAGCGYIWQVYFALAGQRVLTRVRERLYHHVLELPLALRPRHQVGDVVTRVVSDVGILKEATVTALVPLGANTALLVGMLLIMGIMDWRLALAAALPLPFFVALTTRQTRRIQSVAREQRQREAALASAATESVGALQAVQSLGLESRFSGVFEAANRADLRKGARGKRLASALERGVDVLIGASTALVLMLGAQRVLAGGLSLGELLVFLAYQRRAVRPLRDLAKYSARLAKATAAGERVMELFEEEVDVRDKEGAREAGGLRGALSFSGVSFSYPEGRAGLLDIDLDLEAGEHVALVGPSGAGKTTLFRLLLRLCDPSAGVIRVDGHDLRDLRVASWREQIAVIPEDAPVFRGSLRENVTWGAQSHSDDEIDTAIRVARLDEIASALPEGGETLIGERGVSLSRGQRQRVAIARAALRRAPILLLDEPLTGLDPVSRDSLRQSLDEISRGRTVLWITHDSEDLTGFSRIVRLEAGRVVASSATIRFPSGSYEQERDRA